MRIVYTKHRLINIFLFLLLIILTPFALLKNTTVVHSQTVGNQYYVATNGNDSNAGTLAQPWRTITHAANVLLPGDTVFIRNGSYSEQLTPLNSGTAIAPITYSSYPGETPIIAGGNTIYRNIEAIGRHYIVFDGLTVQEPVSSWAYVENSDHITFQNMRFLNPTYPTSLHRSFQGLYLRSSSYNRVLNSTLDHWGRFENGDNEGNNLRITGSTATAGGYNVVEGNTFTFCANSCIMVNAPYNVVRNNTFNNDWQKGIEVSWMTNPGDEPPGTDWPAIGNLFEGNQFVRMGVSQFGHGGYGINSASVGTIFRRNVIRNGDHNGLFLDTIDPYAVHESQGHIYNNTIVNNGLTHFEWLGIGINVSNYGFNYELRNDVIKNNILWGNLPGAGNNPFELSLDITGSTNFPPYGHFTIAGNIIQNLRPTTCTPTSGDCSWIIQGSTPNTGNATNLNSLAPGYFFSNIENNPQFVTYNPGANSFDLHLLSNSGAIDQAVNLTTTTAAGTGTAIGVVDVGYFNDGYGGMAAADSIQIGSEVVNIVSIDRTNNILNVDRSITWTNGAGVNLPYNGSAPDIGAYEFGGAIASPTPQPSPSNVPTPTPLPSGTPSPTPTATPLPTATPSPTPTPLPSPTPSGLPLVYLSLATDGTVGGLATANEDILTLDRNTGQYQIYFDGSNVGLSAVNLVGFYIRPNGHILFSTDANVSLAGIGTVVPQDIVEFTPTSLGANNTAGTFSLFFHGTNVGLTTSSERIDAISVLADGRIIISTTGSYNVPGAGSGGSYNLLAFTPTGFGLQTAGTWSLYFDGLDVGMGDQSGENIDAAYVAPNGVINFSTTGSFNVPSQNVGTNHDIVAFTPTQLGNNTAGMFGNPPFFIGNNYGLNSFNIDGFQSQ